MADGDQVTLVVPRLPQHPESEVGTCSAAVPLHVLSSELCISHVEFAGGSWST